MQLNPSVSQIQLECKTPKELQDIARSLGKGYECVMYRSNIYMPSHHEQTLALGTSLTPEEKTWQKLSDSQKTYLQQQIYGVLFPTEKAKVDFWFMVSQTSEPVPEEYDFHTLLIRTKDGLRELKEDGTLHVPSGNFIPNTLPVVLNESQADQMELWSIMREWVGGEDEVVESLLAHLATALAPHWSAVRYVLLLGEGRNGKSVLLDMLHKLFGNGSCSSVTRQEIAEDKPTVTALNGTLINIVHDGVARYLKDSGNEKTLIAGEPAMVRRLYQSSATRVQTNALFIEGLNREPKSSDKTQALQARIVRYRFPNTYAHDTVFHDKMVSDRYVGALLGLLINRYVRIEDAGERLKRTAHQQELELDHLLNNSLAVQYIEQFIETSPMGSQDLIGWTTRQLFTDFMSWRVKCNDYDPWNTQSVAIQFAPYIRLSSRKSVRTGGVIMKERTVEGFTAAGQQIIDGLTGGALHGHVATAEDVVGD